MGNWLPNGRTAINDKILSQMLNHHRVADEFGCSRQKNVAVSVVTVFMGIERIANRRIRAGAFCGI
jgi:hypothetical protein